jgi:hypothetical protein
MHLFPTIFALLIAYGVSMMSLSRSYAVPTYLIAGAAAAYLQLVVRPSRYRSPRLNHSLLKQLALAEVGLIGAIYLFIKIV